MGNEYGVCSNLASSGEPPPLLHMTTLTTAPLSTKDDKDRKIDGNSSHSLRLFSRENAIPVVHII